jgi:hypothetical protein
VAWRPVGGIRVRVRVPSQAVIIRRPTETSPVAGTESCQATARFKVRVTVALAGCSPGREIPGPSKWDLGQQNNLSRILARARDSDRGYDHDSKSESAISAGADLRRNLESLAGLLSRLQIRVTGRSRHSVR